MQVFRTYNASITLDALLHKESTAVSVDERKAEYDRANKEVRRIVSCHPQMITSPKPWPTKLQPSFSWERATKHSWQNPGLSWQ